MKWLLFFFFRCFLFGSIAETAQKQLETLSPEELDRDWQLSSFFGHVKVISSKDSPRYPILLLHLQEVGLSESQFELSSSVTHVSEAFWSRVPCWASQNHPIKQGIAGCSLAHYQLIKDTRDKYQQALQDLAKAPPEERQFLQAQVDRYSSVLIIEDNTAFGCLLNQIPCLEGMGTKLRRTLAQLPEDWDMFYFICLHGDFGLPLAEQIPDCPRLLKATFGLVNKCFAIKASAYERVVQAYKSYIFPSTMNTELPPADHITARLHTQLNAYIAREPLAYRFACPSLVGSSPGINVAENHWQPWPLWEP